MHNPMSLEGKTILITGASSGIGRATAIIASRLGATLILSGRREAALEETRNALAGEKHRIIVFDLESVETTGAFINDLKASTESLDGFVHSAGLALDDDIRNLELDASRKTMTVNLHAFNMIVNGIYRERIFRKGASIVALSSTAALRAGENEMSYAASKAGLEAAVRHHAKTLEADKIRVNTVQPGWVRTPMYDDFLKRHGESDAGRNNLKRQFLGITEPEEVANVIAFLLSDATTSITGSAYRIDGGFLS